jgi:hypothetical protein
MYMYINIFIYTYTYIINRKPRVSDFHRPALIWEYDHAMGIHEVCIYIIFTCIHDCIHDVYIHIHLFNYICQSMNMNMFICIYKHNYMNYYIHMMVRALFVNSSEEDLDWLMKSKLPGAYRLT